MTSSQRPAQLSELLDAATQQLPCGTELDALLEQAADGHGRDLTGHQRDCVHCQAALREFDQLWQPVRELADQPIPLGPALREAVSRQVRKLAADVWYTLQLTDGGAIRIAARVVATIARDTARTVPGVHAALGRSTYARLASLVERATLRHRHPHAAVGVLGRTAVVDLALAVSYGDQVDAVAREVQRRVVSELRTKVGLQDVAVNITVDDII